MKLIEAAWLSYREAVVPQNAPSIQLQECRRAFYAGACGLYTEIMRMLEPGTEPTDADLKMMAGIDGELRSFSKSVQQGRA